MPPPAGPGVTVATVVVLLLQAPPPLASVSVIVAETHTAVGPRNAAAGGGLITTVDVPDILPGQPVVMLVATTVVGGTGGCPAGRRLSDPLSVPPTGAPTTETPLTSLVADTCYGAAIEPTSTPEPPAQ